MSQQEVTGLKLFGWGFCLGFLAVLGFFVYPIAGAIFGFIDGFRMWRRDVRGLEERW